MGVFLIIDPNFIKPMFNTNPRSSVTSCDACPTNNRWRSHQKNFYHKSCSLSVSRRVLKNEEGSSSDCFSFFSPKLTVLWIWKMPITQTHGSIWMFQEVATISKIVRTYNSRSLFSGMFGFGWCSDFETSMEVNAEGNIKVKECGGGMGSYILTSRKSPAKKSTAPFQTL